MLSPTQLLKRIGVGGGLVPFFKCVCVYFAAGSEVPPSGAAVAAKVAPILCLLLFVLARHGPSMHTKGGYARRIALGLALSAVGDALLVFPAHLAPGMLAFGGAHAAYLSAFGWGGGGGGGGRRQWAGGAALAVCAAWFVSALSPPAELRAGVWAYSCALAAMAWRGVARGGWGAPGAALFLLSDALLAHALFSGPVPYERVLVMSTYYLGQLGIALSVLDEERKQLQ